MIANYRNRIIVAAALLGLLAGFFLFQKAGHPKLTRPPNFLLVITDDQSWIHNSYAGYPAIKTPNFDRIAQEGVYFENAYASAPTCTASRSAILAGQHFWRLGPAAQLWGEYPVTLVNYQKILEAHGYKVGYTGKGWGPGKSTGGNPAGQDFNKLRNTNVDSNLSQVDHVANLREFLKQKAPGQPFSFWVSPTEPHRPYKKDSGVESGKIDINKVEVPPFLPDTREVRMDIADYLFEIEWFDDELSRVFAALQEAGELDNTVIVYTSDNGMPFPRAKSNNYEYGTHVPMAIRWGSMIKSHQQVTDFISLTDLAPTFLDLAGISIPAEMTGKSFKEQLLAGRSGRIDKQRNTVFSGFERHIVDARIENRSYPSRALHTDNHLYIRNLNPERWPAGRPPQLADIDNGSPTKNQLTRHQEEYARFWDLAAAKRPAEELYDVRKDVGQITNIAGDPEYSPIRKDLAKRLASEMQKSGDPCAVMATCDIFDSYFYNATDKD
ncbi:MAG TPA: sulfatase [Pseudomonadales bacterium]|nr:sulfatase [Pseudomonadales bacterium]